MAAGLLVGCGAAREPVEEVFRPAYLGADVRLLDDTLVRLTVSMEGARDPQDIVDYADCVVARDAETRGFAFARQVRTNVMEEGGLWSADAVYTVSPALPRGLKTIDVGVAMDSCRDEGIPTT